jgi:WS/DGAT/MGAT family acyltransferase
MPPADAAWLHMERPTNPMVVSSLIMLGGTPDLDAIAERLEERLVGRFPRFSQRVVDPLGRAPAFEDDPSFDLRSHLHRRVLPAPGNRAALEALVGDLITPPIDPGKPLWHAYLIEGYEGGAAILWRIHHCIADGIALSSVLLSTADEADTAIELAPARAARSTLGRLAEASRSAVAAARRLGGAAVHEGMESLAHPDHLRDLADAARRDTSTAAKLVGTPADAPTDLRAPLTGTRRVAWSRRFPLAPIKAAGRRKGATINDVLVAALIGSLQQHLGANGERPEEIHTMVPFNLRPPEEPISSDLGNDFALILLALPMGGVGPDERLREVHRAMAAIKDSHEALLAYGLISAMGLTPPWVEERLIGFFTDKASLVITNVPGPRAQLSFAGAPITGVLVWAPCSGSLGMTVSIFSYAGEVTVGFMADTALHVDPEPLARAYEAELRSLVPNLT